MDPLVSTEWLAQHFSEVRVADVRWYLGRPAEGRRAHAEGHIPGARFLDIDEDLAGHGEPGRGRHPLPSPERLVETLAAAGIGQGDRVVAYDDAGGTTAARLWWLLRWLGGEAAVLDGGLPKWRAEGRPIEATGAVPAARAARPFSPRVRREMIVDKAGVKALVDGASGSAILLDARAGERFRGEVEPIDPRAGHIPDARSAPAMGNLTVAAPVFRSAAELRARFLSLGVTDASASEAVCYCGSGVTACHDLLALELAGFSGARLYPGSWSEWCADPTLPVAVGA